MVKVNSFIFISGGLAVWDDTQNRIYIFGDVVSHMELPLIKIKIKIIKDTIGRVNIVFIYLHELQINTIFKNLHVDRRE